MSTVVQKRIENPNSTLVICDVSPPRDYRAEELQLCGDIGADFVSFAYNPGKSPRVHPALAALWLKQNTSSEPVFTLTTRDMNELAFQSLLLGLALHGLENVVIVAGDAFTKDEASKIEPISGSRPSRIIKSIHKMNMGLDFKGRKLDYPTNFCLGATIDLGNSLTAELELTRRKLKAGAQYFFVQALFDPNRLLSFIEEYERLYNEAIEAPLFCGVQIMVQGGKSFGKIPEWVTLDLDRGRSGVDIAVQLIKKYQDIGFNSIYLIPSILNGGERDYNAAYRVIQTIKI